MCGMLLSSCQDEPQAMDAMPSEPEPSDSDAQPSADEEQGSPVFFFLPLNASPHPGLFLAGPICDGSFAAPEKFSTSSRLQQYFAIIPAKLRLVALLAFLQSECFRQKGKVSVKSVILRCNPPFFFPR